ncbi:arylamine N-acetyltransferase family protein [Streptomyces sp. NBC_00503]|uniref:arylamine N-acetyltransferase family protein n=1 Tax=Streptomyces sp. NBC_00503 TaxID=2903659 RepID=UPI002E8167C6|nr:arylamine N-acetyltransferase [Streptomyces sp. NBC_00503]WUD82850.1 arylamine N-acetyltransferase [Streptomyces sp. NBC_00503]
MTSGMNAGISDGAFASYLRRLGITGPLGAPSAEELFALQRAHLERVPYENVDIQLGRSAGIDPGLSVRRFAAGRGGYCFHLNGAFAALLEHLGYAVTRHLGGVVPEPDPEADPVAEAVSPVPGADADVRRVSGNHLALTVRVGGQEYFVDAGLGDGPYEPLPLREGPYRQGGFGYSLERLDSVGWTYRNPGSSAAVVDFLSAPAKTADFEAEHLRLSTSEDSGFVRAFAALRRDADGIDVLRGRVLSRIDPVEGTTERVLEGPEEFYAVLEGVFGRELDDLTPADRAALWTRVDAAHEAWLETRRG